MKASDMMTPHVVTVGPDVPIAQAIRLMLQNRISGLPVVDAAGTMVGIVTEGDFLRRSELGTERQRPRWLEFIIGPGRLADEYVHTHARKVGDVMTRDVAYVAEDTPVGEMVRLMEKRRVKRLPVLRGGRLVGIVSRASLLRALARIAAKSPPAYAHGLASDMQIREQVLAELDKQVWAPRALVDVTVVDGIVQLRGTIFAETDRQALRVLAENIPGVGGVEDLLEYSPPIPAIVV